MATSGASRTYLFAEDFTMSSHPGVVEEFQVSGPQLLGAVKDLFHQGNIRRIAIRNREGMTLLEIPLVVGVAAAALVPVWAAVGALAALVAKCTLVVERTEIPSSPATDVPEGRAGEQPPS